MILVFVCLLVLFGILISVFGTKADDSKDRAWIRERARERGGEGYFVEGKCAGMDTPLCGENCAVRPCVMCDFTIKRDQDVNVEISKEEYLKLRKIRER